MLLEDADQDYDDLTIEQPLMELAFRAVNGQICDKKYGLRQDFWQPRRRSDFDYSFEDLVLPSQKDVEHERWAGGHV